MGASHVDLPIAWNSGESHGSASAPLAAIDSESHPSSAPGTGFERMQNTLDGLEQIVNIVPMRNKSGPRMFSNGLIGATYSAGRFEGVGSMLAIAISLLFGLAAFAALAVIHGSLVQGVRNARRILAELSPSEARPTIRREAARRPASPRAVPLGLAAA